MLIFYKQNLFAEIKNFNNFKHFGVLLNTILTNIEQNKKYIDINFAIIYIAEKTFYKNKENSYNKIYLCGFLSKNRIFSDKNFWLDLIELKLNSVAEMKLEGEIKKREKEFLIAKRQSMRNNLNIEKEKRKDSSNSSNSADNNNNKENDLKISSSNYSTNPPTQRKSLSIDFGTNFSTDNSTDSSINNNNTSTPRKTNNGLMGLFGNKVRNFFSNNNNNYNYNNQTAERVEIVQKFEKFVYKKEEILEEIKQEEILNILREFVAHFSNFNFEVSEANDLIVEYSIIYKFNKEKVMLFVNMLNSNSFTIKNKSKEFSLIDYNKNDKIFNSEKKLKKLISNNDRKFSILFSSLKYLEIKDYSDLFLLNRIYNKNISKMIHSKVLLNSSKNNQRKVRLEIWRKVLKIVNYKLNFILIFI